MKRYFCVGVILFVTFAAFGQINEPAHWNYEFDNPNPEIGDTIEVLFKVDIDRGWYLYSTDFDPDLGPTVTTFDFNEDKSFALVGDIIPVNPKKKYDDIWEGDVTYFIGKALFKQKILIISSPLKVSGIYDYQVCTDEKCIPFDDEFRLEVLAAKKPIANLVVKSSKTSVENTLTTEVEKTVATKSETIVSTANNKQEELITEKTDIIKSEADREITASMPIQDNIPAKKSLWGLFLLAFVGGLAAIITPCVFPMIPMTVSFFMHSSENKAKAKFQASVYGISIIGIYTIIGTIVAVTLGANFANFLSTHWIPNVLFFLVFVIFAASFFGMFEITLPSWMVNKSDKQADKGGISGSFFMAFTLVLVSFSCTGPIVGAILVASASGEVLEPIIGMLGFSVAFALPFTFFALFPSLLSNLPKSGGWLNSVKVVLGFIELALGLKFLSIADQTYHWGILDREVYLALWIIIFTLMGFYLLGKLKFAHDSDIKFISVPRLILAIVTFAFVIYLIPGMIGAPLKLLSGYIPPQTSLEFNLPNLIRESQAQSVQSSKTPKTLNSDVNVKYSDFLHLPHGIKGYFDYKQGLERARELNKPVFIDFTGHGCVNCREMEANVWSDPRVLKRLKEEFVVIALYVDDKTKLPEEQWYTSEYDGKIKKTIGKQNADFQIKKYNVNAQPYYIIMDHNEKPLVNPRAYDLNADSFVEFLNKGILGSKGS